MTMTMTAGTGTRSKFAFVERALRDFDLLDAFLARDEEEREAFERWFEEAESSRAEEERVSQLLDCLDAGLQLPPYRRRR